MRRGFKAWCENTATEYRSALGLGQDDRLDPESLAAHLDVRVWRPEDVPELPEPSLQQLTIHDPDSWSAMTLQIGDTSLSIVNSAHPETRQRSSPTHELAHLILDHGPGRIDLSPAGHLLLNSFEKEQEDEADWLSATLLVPRAGLQAAYRSIRAPRSPANHFGVSLDMLNWRLRMTGVTKQMRRAFSRPRRL